jgi:hypothetical protein
MKQEISNKQIRCSRLGDETPFFYCLQEAGDFPCSRIVNCWYAYFDIESFLKEKLAPEKWNEFMNFQPKDKTISLIELIETVKAKR